MIGAKMTEFFFPRVSVASSGGEYFQVSFEENEDSENAYFLIQRQFESSDGGLYYLESHDRRLCGHFRIRRAELARDSLRLEVACDPAETVHVRFRAGDVRFSELKRILRIMMPARTLIVEDRHAGYGEQAAMNCDNPE